jgi:phosphoribosylglycinamide formyltransferase 1
MKRNENERPLRIGVLGSGKGSNCQSIIDAIESQMLNATVVCVLSDVENAFILERAAQHGIPAEFISGAPFKNKLEGEAETKYIETLRRYGTEVIALAGFMRIIKKGLLSAFPQRILNIHPSLLPAFPGVAAWKQALDYGVKVTGCTVHLVDEGTDSGPVVVQRSVPVLDTDTPATLHARIQVEEHKAYPEALRLIEADRLSVDGRRTKIRMD